MYKGASKDATEIKKEIQLEIAHVLFTDIVGYSKLLLNEQHALLETLNQVVRATDEFRRAEAAGRLIKIPTGDGMALVFYNSPEAPVECALEITRALKEHPELHLRMGVHSGPVSGVIDVNERANVAGAGINMAQRVMDLGDAGHILLSKHVAEDLEHSARWKPLLHDLGEIKAKHGVRVLVVNLYTDELGNPELPEKFKTVQQATVSVPMRSRGRRSWIFGLGIFSLVLSLIALAVIFVIFAPTVSRSRSHPSVSKTVAANAAAAMSIPEKSIAVLPFENLSDDKQNAYFTDGVQDEILTDLAKIADLKVISRTSVMQYKNAALRNLREIGQQLAVACVLEGSVQRANNRVRINAQLIDARTDAHLWAQTYDRELADTFAIQSEIAETIAHQLQARLSPTEKAEIAKSPTADLAANDLYVRAQQLDDTVNDPGAKENLLEGVRLLEEAVKRDPHFLLAYCLLSETNLDLYWGGFDHTTERRELARVALEHAEALQPDAGEVHLQKGAYAYHGFRDYDRAHVEFEIARRKLPNAARIFLYEASVDRRQARWEDALRNFDRAAELDPRNFFILEEAAFTRLGLRRYAEAKVGIERALAIAPADYFLRTKLSGLPYDEHADLGPWRAQLTVIWNEGREAAAHVSIAFILCALAERDRAAADRALSLIPPEGALSPTNDFLYPREWFVGLVARSLGDPATARSAFTAARGIAQEMVRGQPEYAPAWSLLGMVDAGLGRKTEAIAEGKRGCELLPIAKDAWEGPAYVTNLALIYAWVGEKDRALDQLAISPTEPTGVTYGELKLSPQWDSLRGDRRFDKIVADLASK